eukprot:gene8417-30431_t
MWTGRLARAPGALARRREAGDADTRPAAYSLWALKQGIVVKGG